MLIKSGANKQNNGKWFIVLLALTVIAMFSTVVIYLNKIQSDLSDNIARQYALMEIADILYLYLLEHSGESPDSWNDLNVPYREVDRGYGLGSEGLKTLRKLVHIDFYALKISHKDDDPYPPPLFVSLRNGDKSVKAMPAQDVANNRISGLLHRIRKE